MWQRYTFYDLRVVAHYLGDLILLLAAVLVVPFVTAVVFREWDPAVHYLYAIGISLIVGTLLCYVCISPGQLSRQQALAVTGFAWIALALIGAIPLFLSGHYGSYLDALFDAVSGFTSTGASVISDLDHLAYSDNMWRFVMHFVGGLGLVVILLSLGMGGRGASSMYSTEGRSEHVLPNIVQTARLILRIAVVMVGVFGLVLGVCCVIAGMEPVRAFLHGIWLAITGFVTAGFTPMASNVYAYHSIPLEIALMVLMLLGGLNFGLYAALWKGRTGDLLEDSEVRAIAVWLTLLTAVTALSLAASASFSEGPAIMRRGLFMVVSAASTSGLMTVTGNQLVTSFSSGSFLVLALAMSVGLASGSTAGGIKINRLSIITRSILATIKQTASADSAVVISKYYHVGKRVVSDAAAKEAMTIFALFIAMYAVGTLAAIAYGYEATSAIFDSVAMASNGGLTSGIVAADMPAGLELLYIMMMWAGRLEFVTLFALVMKLLMSAKDGLRQAREDND